MKPSFELYQDAKGEWRWRLIAENGRTIADSAEGYVERQDCEHGIELVRTHAGDADLVTDIGGE